MRPATQLITSSLATAIAATAIVPHPIQHPGLIMGHHEKGSGPTHLYVSSYVGDITTLSFAGDSLSTKHTVNCANNASWLTFDKHDRTVYCLDEGLTVPNGTVHSYKASADGVLTPVTKKTTISGPVSGVLYGSKHDKQGLALAHYGGSAVTAWQTDVKGNLEHVQDVLTTLAKPGPNADRQDAPHEHEAILDPTGKYIIVPDLGADLVRVFSFDPDTLRLKAEKPLTAAPGSGPRHGVFWKSCHETYFYLVSELVNTLTGYRVSYPSAGGVIFEELFVTSTYGDKQAPAGGAVAEVHISPDHRFIIVSNRNDSSFSIPNFNPANKTEEQSDSLATWALKEDGGVEFKQLAAAGGSFPRHFSMNREGSLISVALQLSSRVVVLPRDTETGKIGSPVANATLPGELTCVMWDEPDHGSGDY